MQENIENIQEKKKPGFWRLVWRNKLYIILVIALASLFTLSQFSPEVKQEKEAAKEQTVKVQSKLKQAEQSFRAEVKAKGSMQDYLAENPKTAALINYAMLFFIALIIFGVWIDGWCLIRKIRGQSVLRSLPFIDKPRWSVAEVFKVMILFLVFSIIIGWIGEIAGYWAPEIFNRNGQLILHGTLADLAVLFLILYFSKVKYGQPFFKNQIRKEKFWKDVGIGISAYLALLPILIALIALLVWIIGLFQYEPPPQKIVEVFVEESRENPVVFIYAIFLASVIGPAIEEIFFRGFFYSALRKTYPAVPCALVVAVFFALLHQSAFAFLPIFVLSLILTYLYEKRKSIVAPIAFHIFHNLLFIGYFFLMKESILDKFLH